MAGTSSLFEICGAISNRKSTQTEADASEGQAPTYQSRLIALRQRLFRRGHRRRASMLERFPSLSTCLEGNQQKWRNLCRLRVPGCLVMEGSHGRSHVVVKDSDSEIAVREKQSRETAPPEPAPDELPVGTEPSVRGLLPRCDEAVSTADIGTVREVLTVAGRRWC